MQTRASNPSAPTAANAVRQPARSPMNVPVGTPRTEAVSTPPKITAVARGTWFSGTSRRAMPPASDQKPPTLMPIRKRARRTRVKSVANADARFAAPTSPTRRTRTARRSKRPVATVTSGAEAAATNPGTVTMRPAVPADTSRSLPTGVSRPTGSSSEVISEKMPSVTARTASQPFQDERRTAAGALTTREVMTVSAVLSGGGHGLGRSPGTGAGRMRHGRCPASRRPPPVAGRRVESPVRTEPSTADGAYAAPGVLRVVTFMRFQALTVKITAMS